MPPFVSKAMAGTEEQDSASKFSAKTLDLLAGVAGSFRSLVHAMLATCMV